MAATSSRMLDLGTIAPPFSLPDPDGVTHSLDDSADAKACLVMFICNHCPYVKHVADELARLGRDYQARDVAIYAINSNDAEAYPGDSRENMAQEIEARGYPFPYLVDASQDAARAYRAACTPDFFLFNANRSLVYRGQLDGSRPGNQIPVNGADLRRALDEVLSGKPVSGKQTPSIGCGIKWKPGSAPEHPGG